MIWRLPLLFAVALGGGLFLFLTRQQAVVVSAISLDRGRVESIVANTRAGSITACRRAKLAPPAAGRIERLMVRKGQRVAAGELLLELWNDDLAARERVAREQLATARARVDEVCQLAAASDSEAQRARRLHDRGFVSEERVVRAEAQAHAGAASCASARTLIQEAQARLAAARADTARTRLTAPFAGIVAEINGEVGEYLTPSPPGIPTLPAIDLIDDGCLYVSAPIDEVDAARLTVGMPARVSLDAFRGRHFTGHVRRIAPYVLALEKQARTVEVEVELAADEIAAAERPLLVGYSADIEVIVEARDDVPFLPTAALLPGNKVLVIDGDRLEERIVQVGLNNWERSEIRAGLQPGERVVASLDRQGLKSGARVRIEAAGTTK